MARKLALGLALAAAADADILATDLDGTAPAESRAAYEGYGAAAETAGIAVDACLAGLAPL
ncbi:MAG TPA: hypothetical protein GYA10_00505 [Alphaproteobacteria bacterium]|nr:hypothetical protein [Alphaproteobacteria bacterium]